MIYFNFEYHAPNCPRKIKVQNMFRVKPTITTVVVAKASKLDNVLVNVVVMTRNQVPKQQMFKKCELMKVKTIVDWQIEKQTCDSFVHIIKELTFQERIIC
jgi:hypothetical protein